MDCGHEAWKNISTRARYTKFVFTLVELVARRGSRIPDILIGWAGSIHSLRWVIGSGSERRTESKEPEGIAFSWPRLISSVFDCAWRTKTECTILGFQGWNKENSLYATLTSTSLYASMRCHDHDRSRCNENRSLKRCLPDYAAGVDRDGLKPDEYCTIWAKDLRCF